MNLSQADDTNQCKPLIPNTKPSKTLQSLR